MNEANLKRFDVVLIWRFDRFARSTQHMLKSLQIFKSLGIEFASLTEQIDTATPPNDDCCRGGNGDERGLDWTWTDRDEDLHCEWRLPAEQRENLKMLREIGRKLGRV